MNAHVTRACLIAMVASLSACATNPAARGVDVTRFHLGQPIARGQIALEPIDPARAGTLEFRTYADPVARRLAALGWSVVGAVGQSEQVATVHVERGGSDGGGGGSPVHVGVGGSTGSYGGGVGLGLGIGLGGGRCDTVGTSMEVRIKRRSDGTVFWEGRGITEACVGSPEAQPAAAAEKLAEALFRDFPGESGRTIRVE
jgi:hypothetical protein